MDLEQQYEELKQEVEELKVEVRELKSAKQDKSQTKYMEEELDSVKEIVSSLEKKMADLGKMYDWFERRSNLGRVKKRNDRKFKLKHVSEKVSFLDMRTKAILSTLKEKNMLPVEEDHEPSVIVPETGVAEIAAFATKADEM